MVMEMEDFGEQATPASMAQIQDSTVVSAKKNSSGNLVIAGPLKVHKNVSKVSTAFTQITEETKRIQEGLELGEIESSISKFFSTICLELDIHFLRTVETYLIDMFSQQQKKSEDHYNCAVRMFLTKFMVENVNFYKSNNKVKCVSGFVAELIFRFTCPSCSGFSPQSSPT